MAAPKEVATTTTSTPRQFAPTERVGGYQNSERVGGYQNSERVSGYQNSADVVLASREMHDTREPPNIQLPKCKTISRGARSW